MILGSLMLHSDYAVLKDNRSAHSDVSTHLRIKTTTLLQISSSNLPHVPEIFSDEPLPPDMCVSEPLIIRYFSIFVADIPVEQRVHSVQRYDAALRM